MKKPSVDSIKSFIQDYFTFTKVNIAIERCLFYKEKACNKQAQYKNESNLVIPSSWCRQN